MPDLPIGWRLCYDDGAILIIAKLALSIDAFKSTTKPSIQIIWKHFDAHYLINLSIKGEK